LAKGQDSAALSGRFISPPDRHCQRLLSTNRRITRRISHCEEVSIFKDFTPYLSHNPATFWHYVSIESPDDQWGLPAVDYSRDRRSQMNPSPFPYGLETSRDLHTIVVRDPGLPFGL
jgi:hypothetical protein